MLVVIVQSFFPQNVDRICAMKQAKIIPKILVLFSFLCVVDFATN